MPRYKRSPRLIQPRLLRKLGIGMIAASTSLATSTGWAGDDAPAAAEEIPAEQLETARAHFKNGVKLISGDSPNYQDAYRQFQLAYEKSGANWKALGNLGFCAFKLERDGEALKYYKRYLKEGGDAVDSRERKQIRDEMLLIEGNMGHVQLKAESYPLRVTVSREGSSVPAQVYILEEDSELGLRSGTLEVSARQGDLTRSWTVILAPEERVQHRFDFGESAAPVSAAEAATSAEPESPQPTSSWSGLRIAGAAVAGVGVLGLGTGVVAGLVSTGKEASLDDDCIQGVCLESAENTYDSARTWSTVANVSLVAGGVLLAGGVTMFVLGKNEPAETVSLRRPRLRVAPEVGRSWGLVAAGEF